MANEVNTPSHGLAITVTVAAALEAGRLVRITANNQVGDAGATHHVVGFTQKETKAAGDLVAVELTAGYTKKIKTVAAETLAAGEFWKAGAASGAVQRVAKFVVGTDAEHLKGGVVLAGGAADAEVTVLA